MSKVLSIPPNLRQKAKRYALSKRSKKISLNECVRMVIENSLGPSNAFDNADTDRQSQQDLEIVFRKGEASRKDPKTYKKLDDAKDDDKVDYSKVKPTSEKDLNDFVKTQISFEDAIGKHERVNPDIFDQKQLSLGKKIEHEHTSKTKEAVEIAKDHLSEIPDYYTRLMRMEKNAEKSKSKK